jgi:glycosyltransferase involved in cell wall biosynthesis
MRVLMPFWRLENFDRYVPQMTAIANLVDEFHIEFTTGTPNEEWRGTFDFHKLNIGYPWLNKIMMRWFLAKKEVLKEVGQIEVDLYYALSDWWSQQFCYDCSYSFKKPYAVRLRGDYIKDMDAKNRNAIIQWVSKRSKLKSFRNADLMMPVSKNVRDSAMEWIGNPTKLSLVVPSGVDTKKFRPEPAEKLDFTVACVGRISPEKGIETLVETMHLASDTRFIVAGEKQMEVEFPENCEYLGRIPYEQMPDIYNQADLVILTSETEGMPLVILEAYACDVPVLTHKDVFPSELPIYGIVQQRNDPKEYVESIHRIKEGDYNMINARSYVDRYFSWKNFGEKMYEQFEIICGNKTYTENYGEKIDFKMMNNFTAHETY